jgi:hypothetical protein
MRINLATVLMLAGVAPLLAQESPANRTVHVVVNDPLSRVVSGLSQTNFDVTEGGTVRPITAFAGTDAPISVAIVGQNIPPAVMMLKRTDDEFVQAASVADALRVLAAAKNQRKALIFASGTIVGEVPSDVHVVKAVSPDLMKAVLEAVNSYSLGFSSSRPAAAVEIGLNQPAGLPRLTVATR